MAIALLVLTALLAATAVTARPDGFDMSARNQQGGDQQWQWAAVDFASAARSGGPRQEDFGDFRDFGGHFNGDLRDEPRGLNTPSGWRRVVNPVDLDYLLSSPTPRFYPLTPTYPMSYRNARSYPMTRYPLTRSYPMTWYPSARSNGEQPGWNQFRPDVRSYAPTRDSQRQEYEPKRNHGARDSNPRQFAWPYFPDFSATAPGKPSTQENSTTPIKVVEDKEARSLVEISRSVELDVDAILNRKWVGGKPLPAYAAFFVHRLSQDGVEAGRVAGEMTDKVGTIEVGTEKVNTGKVSTDTDNTVKVGTEEDFGTENTKAQDTKGDKVKADKAKSDEVKTGEVNANDAKTNLKAAKVKTDKAKTNQANTAHQVNSDEARTAELRELPAKKKGTMIFTLNGALETFDEDDNTKEEYPEDTDDADDADTDDDNDVDVTKPDVEVTYEDDAGPGGVDATNSTEPNGSPRPHGPRPGVQPGLPSGFPLGVGFPLGIGGVNQGDEGVAPSSVGVPQGPIIRRLVVRRGGVAVAGPGGVATAGPGGVAIVGPGGVAYTRPQGVAIVGPGGKVVALSAGENEPRGHGEELGRVVAYGPIVYFHPADA